MKKVLKFRVAACAVFWLSVATATAAPAQTFTTLLSFDGTDGANPEYMSLVQSIDGSLYGTTYSGGNSLSCLGGCGTVFKLTPEGTLTTIYSFCSQTNCTDGEFPSGSLVQATDGNLYGTSYGGPGTVFRITPEGALTTLYTFCALPGCRDGENPIPGVIQAADGDFYGTTVLGGQYGDGTVFKITPRGTLTTLYSFCTLTTCTDGEFPYGPLFQGTDGNFYGTTDGGGTGTYGTVFKITPGGRLTTLHSFFSTDGIRPYAGLVQATNGSFYGTTTSGGSGGFGTIFAITAQGTLTTLHSFLHTDGNLPYAGLVQATDGNLYGTTYNGGTTGVGTIFQVTAEGTLTTLYSFLGTTDGYYPYGGLAQATDGTFFGTTHTGGTHLDGTVFSLGMGLGPFVKTLPTVGNVGRHVIILGNGLMGASSVTFNGTAAAFTVASSTELKTTVPTGATSGKVQVTTPSGTLTSNGAFHVK